MRVILSKMLAVGLGLIASAGMAVAQQPAAPAAQPAPVTPVMAAPAAPSTGGCSSCGTSGNGKHSWGLGRGTAMPIGCACTHAQATFLFGSCNQFYGPGKDCSRCGFGRGTCHNPITNGIGAPVPPCVYSSYQDR